MALRLLFSIALCICLFACNGARVVGNTYSGAGNSYSVAKDFEYIGTPPPSTISGVCTGVDCDNLSNAKIKIFEDMFISNMDGKTKEFITFSHLRLFGNYIFNPLAGNEFMFGDKQFIEEFGFFQYVPSNSEIDVFLKKAGVKADGMSFYTIRIARNISSRSRELISYVCCSSVIPDTVKGNAESEKEYLRNMILKRIACMH